MHDTSFVKQWYVIQTKPREEDKAAFFLTQKGIEVYLPKIEVAIFHGGRSMYVLKPLFPRYLFARFIAQTEIDRVRWTKGVTKVLWESIKPTPISEAIIEAIKTLECADGIIRRRKFKKNDKIKIVRGPLKDIEGIFEQWTSDKGRVRVLLNLISYQARVELHHSLIEKAE